MTKEHGFLKDLFQTEFAKMVAVISRLFGLQHIELAEDIVSETFLQASETWGIKGIPKNPTAWLYAVAKQKTLYHFRRDKIFNEKVVPRLSRQHEKSNTIGELNFSKQHIEDSQLQMLFAICTPAIASEAQIGLALRILCGFGISEIAEAFLSNKETINKRLFRAKEKLRAEKVQLGLPPENQIEGRLDNVLQIIYLLFNEGYYSKTKNQTLRKDLCLEALRLCLMLTVYDRTNLPKTNALVALMCFHASRFTARQTNATDLPELILYDQQNKALWDQALINQGMHFLNLCAQGEEISSYHLEAGIAYWHCVKEDSPEKWEAILGLYDQLLRVNYSPSVALNRIFALYKAQNWQVALREAEKLKMDNNHFYFVLLGELYRNVDIRNAKLNFKKAYSLAKTQVEKKEILAKINGIN
ncbi:MAG: RNA polymerase sigma factor [Sphingobacterium sp.]